MKRIIALSLLVMSMVVYADNKLSENSIIFAGNANSALAQKVADSLKVPLGKALVGKFNDGEIQIQIEENVRNKHVYIIQSTCSGETQSVNDSLMELYLLVRTMKRSAAKTITVVIPYYGYARQDRKTRARVPISAADVACMIEFAGTTRVVTVDLHCGQIQGFFRNVPVDNLYASLVFVPYIVNKKLSNIIVVSPDAGGVDRANQFIKGLQKKGISADLAIISKQREKAGVVSSMHLIGSVQNADAIIVDDLCDTGGTLVQAAKVLKENGARRVFTIVTHPVFSGNALAKIGNSVIDEMIVADTIPLRGNVPSNITVVSVSSLLVQAILCIDQGMSVSALFQ